MPTDNPKVSAYVPQALKDRLKGFREERNGISESQAVIVILADYFQMPEVLGRLLQGSHVGGVTLARMEALEGKLASLTVPPSSIPSELLEKIDQLSLSVESLERRLEVVEHSGLLNRLKSEPREADLLAAAKEIEGVITQGDLALEKASVPIDEEASNRQLELIDPVLSDLPSELLEEIKPIPGTKLSELRFGRGKDTLSGVKRKSPEKITEWTREQDPDKIAWKYVEIPSKGYVPAEELSSEQKSSLLKWIEENLQ